MPLRFNETPQDENRLLDSSPLSPPRSPQRNAKLKKPPPITPNRFNRFWTPRTSSSSLTNSKSGRRLRNITKFLVNGSSSLRNQTQLRTPLSIGTGNEIRPRRSASNIGNKRQLDTENIPSSPPLASSPSKKPRYDRPITCNDDVPSSPPFLSEIFEDKPLELEPEHGTIAKGLHDDEPVEEEEEVTFCQPIQPLRSSNSSLRVLERSFGGYQTQKRGFVKDHCWDASLETRNFVTREQDVFAHGSRNLSFAVAPCRTNSLIAIGHETGVVTLIDSDSESQTFDTAHLQLNLVRNAVVDLNFSSDDQRLVVGCGDRTVRVVDMQTQKTVNIFEGHSGCLKQVRFRPGDDHMIASSCREGVISLWDTRCKGESQLIMTSVAYGDSKKGAEWVNYEYKTDNLSYPVKNWPRAHSDRLSMIRVNGGPNALRDLGKGDVIFSDKDISVTALSFISPERNHLVVTGSEACTSLRLWDIRSKYTRRGAADSVPVSATQLPSQHVTKGRHYGITAIDVNTDSSRIYALSRDGVLYAYSTQHLVLGNVPEMRLSSKSAYPTYNSQGLGPLYGFKHPSLMVSSFYIKMAVQKSSQESSEMITTGSADGNVFVFPTNERELKAQKTDNAFAMDSLSATHIQDTNVTNTTPIYTNGIRLGYGHESRSEVTNMGWTRNGDIISSGDDRKTRIWRCNEELAWEYRRYGDQLGKSTSTIGYSILEGEDQETDFDLEFEELEIS